MAIKLRFKGLRRNQNGCNIENKNEKQNKKRLDLSIFLLQHFLPFIRLLRIRANDSHVHRL